jgi:hypothetical protein
MSRNYSSGVYQVKNKAKYVGKGLPRYRSSWELTVMRQLDENKYVLQWASESIAIQYKHPITGMIARYIPDLFVVYIDSSNTKHAELIEIKPSSQTSLQESKSKTDKIQSIINAAKWKAAQAFCKAQGIRFRVMTEKDIFRGKK